MPSGVSGLLKWSQDITRNYDGVKVTNMTTSWRNGLAFCAIIHHHRPDLIDFGKLQKDEAFKNNFTAFLAAEKLGIPSLLDANDMARLTVPDRLSVITYVMQLYAHFRDRHTQQEGEIVGDNPDSRHHLYASIISNDSSNPENSESTFPENRSSDTENPVTVPEKNRSSSPENFENNSVLLCSAETERVNNLNGNSSPANADGPSSIDSASIEFCHKCGKRVYLLEKVYADYFPFHRSCFICQKCSALLVLGFYAQGNEEGEFVCLKHSSEQPTPSSEQLAANKTAEESQQEVKSSLASKHDETTVSLDSGLNHSGSSSLTDVDLNSNVNLPSSSASREVFIPKLNIDSVDTIPEDQEVLESSARSENPRDSKNGTLERFPAHDDTPENCQKGGGESEISSPPGLKKPVPPPRPSLARRSGSRSPRPSSQERPSAPPPVMPKPAIHERRLVSPKSSVKQQPVFEAEEDYPEDKNPFGDDDEDGNEDFCGQQDLENGSKQGSFEQSEKRNPEHPPSSRQDLREMESKQVILRKKSYDESLNPFGSDDESGTESCTTPAVPKRASMPAHALGFVRREDGHKGNRTSMTPSLLSSGMRRSKRAAPPPPGQPPIRPSSRTSSLRRKTRAAPPRPLPQRRMVVTEAGMSDDMVTTELASLVSQMVELEEKAREVELRLRAELVHVTDSELQQADLFSTWFDLVGRRNELIRRETELIHIRRQLHLDEMHADVEYRLRDLLGKPKNEKSPAELAQEERLLNRLLEIIEEKNALVQETEEERQRRLAEDAEDVPNQDTGATEVEKLEKKKKRLKMKLKRPKKKHITRLLESRGGGKTKHAPAASNGT